MSGEALYITNLGLLDNLAKTQILPYLKGLSEKGVKINILSFEKKHNLENKAALERLHGELSDLNIKWDRLPYHARWGNLRDLLAGLIKTWRIVKNGNISLIHARASIPVLMAFPVAKILGRKLIYDRRGTMAGDFVDDVNVKNLFSIRFFSAALEALDRFIIARSDATVVLSKASREALESNPRVSGGHAMLENIPCATDITRFKAEGPREKLKIDLSGKFVMCYLGSLGTCYLLKEMVSFFKALKSKKENAIFLIISHSDRRYIENVLKNENLQAPFDYIITELNPEEVPEYLTRCDLSVMFIKPVECKIGCSPTKFGESLAAGVPVVINRGIGDMDDIVRKGRVGVIVEDFNDFHYNEAVDRLEGLLSDRRIFKRCREIAVKHFSLGDAIVKYDIIYNRLANGKIPAGRTK